MITQKSVIGGLDQNGNPKELNLSNYGNIKTELVNGINETNNNIKIESNGQNYYDLLTNDFTVSASSSATVGAGSNYTMSATGGWILHPDIKRAKAIQVYIKPNKTVKVKMVCCPIDEPDNSTPEFWARILGTTEQMFVDVSGSAFSVSDPVCSRIVPISCNALKFWIQNESSDEASISWFRMRLIF